MNLSLLAVRLDRRSRSVNLGRALHLIDVASGHEPDPDIIVLPGGCDGAIGRTRSITPAMTETYAASVSAKAREWGVYLAAALQGGLPGSPSEAIVVFDPDGDEVFIHDRGPTAGVVGTMCTAIGDIRMCFADGDPQAALASRRSGSECDVVVVFGEPEGQESWARWVAASRAADRLPAGSFVFGVRAWPEDCGRDDVILSFGGSSAGEPEKTPDGEILHVTIRTG